MTRNFLIIHARSLGRGIGSRQRSSGGADSRPRPGSIAAPTDQAVRMATLGPTQKFSLKGNGNRDLQGEDNIADDVFESISTLLGR